MESKSTTTPNAASAAFTAMMTTGEKLLTYKELIAITEEGDPEPKTVNREKWNKAVKNLLNTNMLTKEQKNKLKGLRDRLRRTRVPS
jgi:hypothetical protein